MVRQELKTIGDLMEIVRAEERQFADRGKGQPLIWYRGHPNPNWELQPGVLRKWFIDLAGLNRDVLPEQLGQLGIEIAINREFRRKAASLLPAGATAVDVYFLAQHHGMPTRLLDWTTNPLAALFFTAAGAPDQDGTLHVLHPRDLIPRSPDGGRRIYPSDVVDIRDPLVAQAVECLFTGENWVKYPFILPIMPDLRTGRMLQQGSCFTLHMPPSITDGARPMEPAFSITTAKKYVIPQSAKYDLLVDLRRVGVNFASLFLDMDNISREIRAAWGMVPSV
jgi:hypothetical protein